MVQYLSDEWMEQAAEALAAGTGPTGAEGDGPVVLQYEVTAAPSGKRSYGLRFADGTVTLDMGPHPDADASFALDYATAALIARGELSTQAAFMQGRIKLGGDVMVLVRQHGLLDSLDDALGDLRGRTEY